tara:strand:- start:3592 stop:4152 length:561 start_codon:yes stop_codon:yes gene_type:complete
MRITVKVGLLFAVIWMAIKMIFFYSGIVGYNVVPAVMLNILCVLLAIAVGMYKHKRRTAEETTLLADIKTGMTAGVPYAVIVSIFLFFYYSKIDTDYIPHRVAEITYEMKKRLDDPEELKRYRTENEDFEVMTKDEIYERMIQGPQNAISAKSTMVLALLALLLLATLNSIFIAIIYRKVLFKQAT